MTAPRILSLALLALLAAAFLAHPEWARDGAGWTVRIGLALALLGAIGAAAHGFGHVPQGKVMQWAQSPKIAWPAIMAGLIVMAMDRFI